MNAILTILTPTYNRAPELGKLYHSLVQQSKRDFTWFIMDDGSTDDTETIVQEYIKHGDIEIVYKKKENGGKHTALNTAIAQIDSELVFIVDSDDILTEDAVCQIYDYHDKYKNIPGLCGYSFLRINKQGQYMHSGSLSSPEYVDSFVRGRINGKTPGDMAEVWYVRRLKEYPFPEFPKEKFLGEDVVWIKMSGPYNIVFIEKTIYICDYLDAGLTKNRRKHNVRSPKGCVLRAKVYLSEKTPFVYIVKSSLQYIVYGIFAGYPIRQLFLECPRKIWFTLMLIPGCMIYFWWRELYLRD